MKKQKNKKPQELYEIVIPFNGNSVGEHMLFDDCPICQDLKKKLESGEVEKMPMPFTWTQAESD